MAGRFCQECGASNEGIAKYCAKCGVELRAGIPAAAPPVPAPAAPYYPGYAPPGAAVPPPYSPYPYVAYGPGYGPAYGPPYPYAAPSPYLQYPELERTKQIDRTKTGLLLLTVGFFLGWVPIIGGLGSLLAFIGAILVILGRKAFSGRQGILVLVAVVVYITSFVLHVAMLAWFAIAGYQAGLQNSPRPYLGVFWPFVGGLIAASSIGAIAQVLFVHELEKPLGRYLLYSALVTAIVVPIATVVALMPSLNAVLTGIAEGTITSPFNPAIGQLAAVSDTLSLVSAIPSVLYGIAYFLAWQRIERREIPAPTAPTPAPAAPFYPYAPPAAPAPGPPAGPPPPP